MSNQKHEFPRVVLLVNFWFDKASARWLRRTHAAGDYAKVKKHLTALFDPLGLSPPPDWCISQKWLLKKRNKIRIRWAPFEGTFHAHMKRPLDAKIAELEEEEDEEEDYDYDGNYAEEDGADDGNEEEEYDYNRNDGEEDYVDVPSGDEEDEEDLEIDLVLVGLNYSIEPAPPRRGTQERPPSPPLQVHAQHGHTHTFLPARPPQVPPAQGAAPAPPSDPSGQRASVPSGQNRANAAAEPVPHPLPAQRPFMPPAGSPPPGPPEHAAARRAPERALAPEPALRRVQRWRIERERQQALSSSAIPLKKTAPPKRPRLNTVQTISNAQAKNPTSGVQATSPTSPIQVSGPTANMEETPSPSYLPAPAPSPSPSPSPSSDKPSKPSFSFFSDRKRPRTGTAPTSKAVPAITSSAAHPSRPVAGDVRVIKRKAKVPKSSQPAATFASPPAEESEAASSSSARPALNTVISAPAVLEIETSQPAATPSPVSPTAGPMQGLPEDLHPTPSPVEADELSVARALSASQDDPANGVSDRQRMRGLLGESGPLDSASALPEAPPTPSPLHPAIGRSASSVPVAASISGSDRARSSAPEAFLVFPDDDEPMAPTLARSPSPLPVADDRVAGRAADVPSLTDNIIEPERGSASPQEDVRMADVFSNEEEDVPASTAPTSSSPQRSITDLRHQQSSQRVQQQVSEPETAPSDAERQLRPQKRQRSESPLVARPAQRMRATESAPRRVSPGRSRHVSMRVPPPPDEASDPEDDLPVPQQKRKRAASHVRSRRASVKRRRSSVVHPPSDADEDSDGSRPDSPRPGSSTARSLDSDLHGQSGRTVAAARPAVSTRAPVREPRVWVELPPFFKQEAEEPGSVVWASVPRSRSTSPGRRSDAFSAEEDELDSSSSSAESSREKTTSTRSDSRDSALRASARQRTRVLRAPKEFQEAALARSQRAQEDRDRATYVPSASVRVDPNDEEARKAAEARLASLRPRDGPNFRQFPAYPAYLDDPEPAVVDGSPRRLRRTRVQRRDEVDATRSPSPVASIAESVVAESSRSPTPEPDSHGSPASRARDAHDDDPMEDEDHHPPPLGPADASNALVTDDEMEIRAVSEDLVDDAASLEPNVAFSEPETGGDITLVEPHHFNAHPTDEDKRAPLRAQTPHIDLRSKARPAVSTPALQVRRDGERSVATPESSTPGRRGIFVHPSSSPLQARVASGSAINMAVDAGGKTDPGDTTALPALFARENTSAAPALDHDMDHDVDMNAVRQLPSSEPVAMPTREPSDHSGAPDHSRVSAVFPSPSPPEPELHLRVERLEAALEEERRVVEEQHRQIAAHKKMLQEAAAQQLELRTQLENSRQDAATERALQGLSAELEMGRQAVAAEEVQRELRAQQDEQRRRAEAAEAANEELAQEHATLLKKFEDIQAALRPFVR